MWASAMECRNYFICRNPIRTLFCRSSPKKAALSAWLLLLSCSSFLLLRGFAISLKAPDLFGTLLAAGLTMVIALESFINIAGVMGIIPLKGLALPFLSYGGTSFVMSMTAVGILLNISTQRS